MSLDLATISSRSPLTSSYAWIELTDASRFGGDATAAMASVGILGRAGVQFGASKRYVSDKC